MTSKRRSSSSKPSAPFVSPPDEAALAPQVSPEPKPIARQAAHESDRIGDILRRVREHRGEDLDYISDYLRIRPIYLFALENSRYEDMPADAYVIGFLRTYAAYLGLDGKGAIDQYRREMAGRRRKPQLSMPQPMSEGRAPTIAVLIGAAIAALIVYGIWYGLSSPAPEALEKPVPLPELSSSVPQETKAEPIPDAASLPAQTATSDGIALSVPATAVTPTTTEPQQQTEPMPTTPPVDSKPAKESKEGKDKEPVATAKEKEIKSKATPEPQPAPQPAPTPAPANKTEAPTAPSPQPTTMAAASEKTRSRLAIKADKESWVLVTDSKGNTVYDRTMKAGEVYNVPAGKGYKLTTGNVSGVQFALDGQDLPKMQSSEPILRALPLEPEKLKSKLISASAPEETPED